MRPSLVIVLLLFWGCQPDKPEPNSSTNSLQLLTGGSSRTWRLQALAIAGTTQPLPPCRTDDRWTFRSNQSLLFQNPTPCLSSEPTPSDTGTFRFTNNNRFLSLSLTSSVETREIIQLSENLLVWTYINDEGKVCEETWVP